MDDHKKRYVEITGQVRTGTTQDAADEKLWTEFVDALGELLDSEKYRALRLYMD
jgi:hypothetical protein